MKRIPRTLHAPASRHAENSERVATCAQNFEDAPRTSVTTRGKQREGRHLRPEFRGRSTRQRHDAPEPARRSPLTSRISRTLHAPALQRTENNERVATYSQNFEDAPRAGVTTRRKLREGRHLRPEFRGRSTRQRHDARKTTRGSPLTPRISKTLHAPASRRAENNERIATYAQNFEDAPRASVMTRRNQREGRHLRPEFRGRSTRQRSNAPKTTRGSPLTARISRTLHALASRRAGNCEKVATYAQNFEDAPRASVTTRGKQREGRHLRPEFRGRSTRQRHDTPETARGSPQTSRISRTLHAPSVTTRGKQREGRHLRLEFRGRSTRQRHDAPETVRRSPLTPRISSTLHAPASRRAENNERVAAYAQNFEDAPRASVTTRRKQREGRHLRPEFRGRSTLQRHNAPKTTRGSSLTCRISRMLHATA